MFKITLQFIQKFVYHPNYVVFPRNDVFLRSNSNLIKNQARCLATASKSKENMPYDKLFKKITKRTESPNDKITVVGGNEIGMATIFSLLTKEITSTVCLLDMTDDELEGEIMDLQHGSLFFNNATINGSKDHAISANSKIVVVTVGTKKDKSETHSDFVSRNAAIMKALIPQLVKYSPKAIFIIASEPVDVMTYVAWKNSGLPKNKVIGSGTNLDTARFRFLLSEKLGVATSSCHALIIGAHGENSVQKDEFIFKKSTVCLHSLVPVWSGVNIAGVRLADLNPKIGTDEDPENWQVLHNQVAKSDEVLGHLKGYNCWAMALSIVDICTAILKNSNCIKPVCTYAKGEHNIPDEVFLSLPCVIGLNGVSDVIQQPLSDMEMGNLRKSAEDVFIAQEALKIVTMT